MKNIPANWYIRLATREINEYVNTLSLWTLGKLVWENTELYTKRYITYDGKYVCKETPGYEEITFEQLKKLRPLEMTKEKFPEKWSIDIRSLSTAEKKIVYDYYVERSGTCYKNPSLNWDYLNSHNLCTPPVAIYNDNGNRAASYSSSRIPRYKLITFQEFQENILKEKINVSEEEKRYNLAYIVNSKEFVVYLDSEKEYNELVEALKTIGKREKLTSTWWGQHCYNLYTGTYSSESSKGKLGYTYTKEGKKLITFSQIELPEKTEKMEKVSEKIEKVLLGYKLKDKQYEKAVMSICNVPSWSSCMSCPSVDFQPYSYNYTALKNAGVLDLWFEAIYDNVYKPGDWIVIEDRNDLQNGCLGIGEGIYQVVDKVSSYGLMENKEGINVITNGNCVWRINGKIRKATAEEIRNAQPIIIMGYIAKFSGDNVSFGCQTYSKRFAKELVEFIDKSGLQLESIDEIREVVKRFK